MDYSGHRLDQFFSQNSIAQKDIATQLDLAPQYINAICRGRKNVSKTLAMRLQEIIGVSAAWLLTGTGSMYADRQEDDGMAHDDVPEYGQPRTSLSVGRPYYNVDFALGFDIMENDQTRTPDYLIDFLPFNDCDCYCNAHGNSMYPTIAADDNWGKPSMVLSYGSHHIYFVASRGEGATLNADSHVIEWELPRDTYWKDYTVDVVSTSNGNRAVTLDRVATKLKITVNDEVPATCASISFTPSQWYYGWDYVAGTPALSRNTERVVTVPASYVGTAGQLTASIFGLSGRSEWTTDVVLSSKDADNNVIGSVTIIGAPFISNRSTEYSGNLFGSSNGIDVTLSTDWLSPVVATW